MLFNPLNAFETIIEKIIPIPDEVKDFKYYSGPELEELFYELCMFCGWAEVHMPGFTSIDFHYVRRVADIFKQAQIIREKDLDSEEAI